MSALGLGDDADPAGVTPGQAAAMRAASVQARATGKAVAVGALTTGTTAVSALANGRMLLTESVLPVRVQRASGWVPVDSSLRLSGGRLAPVAVPESLSLSDGGTGALAVFGAGARSVSLAWPWRLPAPVVSGPVATYRGVLPGVDLAVTASVTGFSEVLIVRNAAAARSPRLAALRLKVAGHGARVLQSRDGALSVVAPDGQALFTAPPPLMWDSPSPAAAVSLAAAGPARPASAGPRAALAMLRSSAAGPGAAARKAAVGMRLGSDGTLSLVPDRAMLMSPSQDFPLYIDPAFEAASSPWQGQTANPAASLFDMVQQAAPCNTVPYTNNESPDNNPDSLGVGYFPSSFGACYGTQDAYYQMPIPQAIWGSAINLATFNAAEDYSASCSVSHDVNLIATATITDSTDYADQPQWYQSTLDVAQNGAGVPDTAGSDVNCNVPALGPSSYSEPYGFTVTSVLTTAAKKSYKAINLVMTESSQDSSGASLKRFTNNPSLTIQYDLPPATPNQIKVGKNSSDLQSCTTTAPLQQLGASTDGLTLEAEYSQANAEALTAYFQYWDVTKGQTATTNAELTTTVPGSTKSKYSDPVTIPPSKVTAWTDADTVDVKTWSVDVAGTSSPSATCSFLAYPTAPGGVTVTMSSAPNPPVGSTATFTVVADTPSKCTVSGVEWQLDEVPTSGSEYAGTLVSGTWTISVPDLSPGEHEVWAYATCSNTPNHTNTDSGGEFPVSGDPPLTCASWAAAMAGQCTNSAGSTPAATYDNTLLSGGDTSCPATSGDGGGMQFIPAELAAQGWNSGAHLTIDGASFTLPAFGTCQADNVLAANQTIDMSGQGSALVFLATSTSAHAAVPAPGGTGALGNLMGSDDTAPPIAAGVGVSGTGCTQLTSFDGLDTGCQPAQGTVTYADGTTQLTQSYTLTVPDWVHGPADIAAVTTPKRQNTTTNPPQALPVKIFAFAVPLNPNYPITSVTLPDVGASVALDGINYTLTGLHIFGMAVRNNTTATPQADGSSAALSATCGCAWTGAYESPVETGWQATGGFGNETIRIAVPLNVSAPAGSQIRVHLADPGFLAGEGDGPISIGGVTVAPQASLGTPAAASSVQQLQFAAPSGGPPQAGVVLSTGSDAYSEPLTLNSGLTAGQDLLVSLYVANGTTSSPYAALGYVPGSDSPSGAEEWTTTGTHISDTTAASFTSAAASQDLLLSGVDVVTTPLSGDAYQASAIASESGGGSYAGYVPGQPTVVAAGNGVIDNGGPHVDVAPDNGSSSAASIRLAGDMATITTQTINGQPEPTAYGYGVVDAGIENNQVDADSPPGAAAGGVSLLARIDRDVLAEPDVGTVVINEGLEDLLQDGVSTTSPTVDNLTSAYSQLITILAGFGITPVFDTLTPCGGYTGSGSSPEDACASTYTDADLGSEIVDTARQQVVNQWFSGNISQYLEPLSFVADTDCAVSSTAPSCEGTEALGGAVPPGSSHGAYDAGDYVNLSQAGYAQAATAIPASDLFPAVFQPPVP